MKKGLTVHDENGEELIVAPFVKTVIRQDPKLGKWENIDMFIRNTREVDPEDFDAHQKEIKLIRETRQNKFASSNDKSLRWGVSLTHTLYSPINKYYPEVLTDKVEKAKFMKRYPQFNVCNEI